MRIEQIMSKLSATFYAMRSVQPLKSQESLMMIYYAYFHLFFTYRLTFWKKNIEYNKF
jgi:hypothetical protein